MSYSMHLQTCRPTVSLTLRLQFIKYLIILFHSPRQTYIRQKKSGFDYTSKHLGDVPVIFAQGQKKSGFDYTYKHLGDVPIIFAQGQKKSGFYYASKHLGDVPVIFVQDPSPTMIGCEGRCYIVFTPLTPLLNTLIKLLIDLNFQLQSLTH